MTSTARFYVVGKSYNSTKRPVSDQSYLEVPYTFKENFNLLHPEILVDTVDVFFFVERDPNAYISNRTRIDEYTMVNIAGRFYRIDNVVYNSVDAVVKLSIDVLATYRQSILMSEQLVARSESHGNKKLLDDNVVCSGEIVCDFRESETIFTPDESDGSILLSTLTQGSNFGNLTYYRLNKVEDLGRLQSELFSSVDWLNIPDLSEEMTKALVNPLQYFISCKQFPFKVSPEFDDLVLENDGSPATEMSDFIRFGFWKSKVVAWRYLDGLAINESADNAQMRRTIRAIIPEIPKHPQAEEYGEFLNLAPYSVYSLDFEPFGHIAIDPLKLYGCNMLIFDIVVDMVTGAACLTLYASEPDSMIDRLVSKHYANVAIDHVLAQTTTDVLGVATTAANTVVETVGHIGGAVYSGFANFGADVATHVTSALTSAISGASQIYRDSFPQSSKQGAMTNHLIDSYATLRGEFKKILPPAKDFVGSPVCKRLTLTSLKGFTKCINPQYDNRPFAAELHCTLEEQHMILRFMEEGFIIE